MGGKAFQDLGEECFPRIPPQTYHELKNRFGEQLKTLFEFVGTPTEAPEKEDHGDVDFIVCQPLDPELNILAKVKEILGAQHAVIAEGNRTSNFAIPTGETLGARGKESFFQVDVHICADQEEWGRTLFFHSYGDLGMILGRLARTRPFTLGTKGLRTHFAQPDDTHISSFVLSESFHDILPFLGLSMDDWEQGFPTMDSIFSWVQTSRFFEPRRLTTVDPSKARKATRQKRRMYSAFLEFSDIMARAASASSSRANSDGSLSNFVAEHEEPLTDKHMNNVQVTNPEASENLENQESMLQDALLYFGKRDMYDALAAENIRRRALREKLNGKQVIKWTGLQGIAVKWVIDAIREKLSEDDIITMQEEELRDFALAEQQKLSL